MQYTPKALSLKVASVLLCSFLSSPFYSSAQDTTKNNSRPVGPTSIPGAKDSTAMGVAISPGKLLFTCKPGNTQSQTVTVTNHTGASYNFRVGFTDYMQNERGKPQFASETAKKNKYSLSKWANASPGFFTLQPGKSQKITVTIIVPNADSNKIAAWTIMEVDQVKKKEAIPDPGNTQSMTLGVSPEIGLGVYIYQNPPNVTINNIEINKFYYRDTSVIYTSRLISMKQLWMEVANVGDGISFCTAYSEITNLQTGKTTRLNMQQFTILPGFTRDFYYDMPKDLEPGNYSAVGVVDFGGKVPKKVAQTTFNTIKK